MVRKLRVSLALQPLATALFANSPFTEGQAERLSCPTARRSGPIRTTTGPAFPRVMFEPGFGFERYVEWLIDTCRCISSIATATISTWPASRSATSWSGGCTTLAGHRRHGGRLRRPHDHGVHRRADQAIPGDARRRCRPAGHDGGAVRALGRAAVRRGGAERGRGAAAPATAWDGCRWRCAPPCRARDWTRRGAAARLRDLARDVVAIAARRAARPGAARCRRARRDDLSRPRWRRSPRARRPRRNIGWHGSRGRGAAMSRKSFPKRAI